MNPCFDMPPRAPLRVDIQDLQRPPAFVPDVARGRRSLGWRVATFLPATVGTAVLLFGLYQWLAGQGMTGLEWAILSMIGATFIWVTLSVSTVGVAVAGLLARADADDRAPRDVAPLDVALLVPIYGEVPEDVFGNAAAMLADLAARRSRHRYAFFVLSDTQDMDLVGVEWRAFEALKRGAPEGIDVHYRRRAVNTDKKVGNLADWIEGWGAGYDGMVVLDADSLMSGRAIDRLASELSADPHAGLIQTFPMLIGAQTLFARLQQFSNIAYGWLLAEGLALWASNEGNYWGHNAIIRTRAFAASAGLPHLRGAWRSGPAYPQPRLRRGRTVCAAPDGACASCQE